MPEKLHVSTLSTFQKLMSDRNAPVLSELDLRLFVAVMLGTKEEVSQVIADGADVNAQNLNHVCPLELANAYKRKAVIKILEENGAKVAPSTSIKPAKKNLNKKG